MTPITPIHRLARAPLPLALLGVVLLAGCADTPPAPTGQLGAAHQAIVSAETADAGRYAPGEIAEARSKLADANREVTAGHMVAAQRLAVESQVEAELASATTSAAKATAVNADLQRGNKALIDEMQRQTGTNP